MAEKQRKNSEGKAKRLANLKPFKKGKSGNPEGRPQGTQNRATVFQQILEKKVDVSDPETGQKLKVSLYEAAALGQIRAAMNGNTNAWKEIQDTLFGKQSNVNFNLNPEELERLTDEELDSLITKCNR